MVKQSSKKSGRGSKVVPKEPEMDLLEINAFWRWEPTKKWYTFPWALLLVACAPVNGTPMRGSADCRYVPSVEDCQMVADRIEDLCLRTCVVHLCRRGRAVCDEAAQVICVELAKEHPGQETGGWVSKGPQTCEMPKEEVNWCQTPHSPPCQAKMMVHELAHACGWHHGEGLGVPSNDGSFKCL